MNSTAVLRLAGSTKSAAPSLIAVLAVICGMKSWARDGIGWLPLLSILVGLLPPVHRVESTSPRLLSRVLARADAGTAWLHGLRLGLDCSRCRSGFMVVLLVTGVMDLRAMVVVATAITIERIAALGERVARATGAVAVVAGLA